MRRVLVAAALLFGAGCLHRDRQMLPPDVAPQFPGVYLAGLGEPALWRPSAAEGYRTRLRLTIAGIHLARVSIRIDERRDGRLSGHVVFLDRHESRQPPERTARDFPVTRTQFERIREATASAGLWAIHPQFYVVPDEICIDGMELIFERVDGDGYRFANGNVPCTAPLGIRIAAARMIEVAGAERALPWIELPEDAAR